MKKRAIGIVLISLVGIGAAVFLVPTIVGKRKPPPRPSPVGQASAEQPNVLFISVDTVRSDHVHSYGYTRATTPQIDRLAAQAFRFTNVISTSSWTIPSHMSMLTGLYPDVHQTASVILKLDRKIVTLAEVLRNNGYYTAGFVSSCLLGSEYGFGRGFDHYDDFTVDRAVGFDPQRGPQSVLLARTSAPLNEAVLAWLKANCDKRFFLFVHYYDPHFAYNPAPPYDTLFDPGYKGKIDGRNPLVLNPGISPRDLRHEIALYDGEIRYTDGYVGALLRVVQDLGISEKTLIILVSDHGEEFLEHGGMQHGNTLYQEVIRVPLIIKLPGSHAPAVINTLASGVDLVPTICDYLKVSGPQGVQGKSLLPAMNGIPGEQRSYVFSELRNGSIDTQKVIVSREYKFVHFFDKGWKELYNLKHDPGEKKNLFAAEPDKAAILQKELTSFVASSAHLASVLRSTDNNRVVHSEDTKQKLKSLGYMQ